MLQYLIFGLLAGIGAFIAIKMKEKGYGYVKQIMVIFVFCAVGGVITFFSNSSLATFETPEDAYEKYGAEEIVTIIDNKDSCMAIFTVEKKINSLLLKKNESNYEIVDNDDCKIHFLYENKNDKYMLLQVPDTEDYYGMGFCYASEKPNFRDNINTEFIVLSSLTTNEVDTLLWNIFAKYDELPMDDTYRLGY